MSEKNETVGLIESDGRALADTMPKRVPLGSGDAMILETHGDEGDEPDDDTEPA